MASHGLVGSDVFRVDALGFLYQSLFDVPDGLDACPLQLFLHATNGPEQVHRRRASFPDKLTSFIEIFLQSANGVGFRVLHGERQPHRGGYADGGGSTYDHVANDIRYLLVRLARDVDFFGRQLCLIYEANTRVGPFKCVNHLVCWLVLGRWWTRIQDLD